jgi:5'-nucleotidase
LDFQKAARIARALFVHLAESPPPPGTCLNVNIPALDAGWPQGVRVCPQGVVLMDEVYTRQAGPDGQLSTPWTAACRPSTARTTATRPASRNATVTVTPLRFDLTDHAALQRLSTCRWPALPAGDA